MLRRRLTNNFVLSTVAISLVVAVVPTASAVNVAALNSLSFSKISSTTTRISVDLADIYAGKKVTIEDRIGLFGKWDICGAPTLSKVGAANLTEKTIYKTGDALRVRYGNKVLASFVVKVAAVKVSTTVVPKATPSAVPSPAPVQTPVPVPNPTPVTPVTPQPETVTVPVVIPSTNSSLASLAIRQNMNGNSFITPFGTSWVSVRFIRYV